MSDGLIRALLISESGLRELDWAGVRAWQPGQGLLWVHLDAAATATEDWLTNDSGLPEIVPPTLLADETRPRASAVGDGVMLNLRGVNLNPRSDPEDMVSIRIWADANRLITTQRRRLLSVDDVVASLSDDPQTGPGDLIARLADRLVERVGDQIDVLEERVADLEQAVLGEPDRAMRSELADLRRDAIALRRYLAPQREALGRLQGEKLSWLTDMDRLRLREVNDRLIRQLEDLDAGRERAAVVQEELLNQLSEQINQRAYVLSIVAAIFLPLGFLTGLLGINVGGIPGAESPYGFIIFTSILVVLVGVQLWFFIRKRWF
jgi:zinc transporter